MRRWVLLPCLGLALAWGTARAGGDAPWAGTWVTDEGALALVQDGPHVTGTYGRGATVDARVPGRALSGTYRVGAVTGRLERTLDEGGHAFDGKWIRGHDTEASKDAGRFLDLWEGGEAGDWVTDFFAWKRRFGEASSARAVVAAWRKRAAEQDPRAKALVDEARKAFRAGDRAGGRRKYEEIREQCLASGWYPLVKRWVRQG